MLELQFLFDLATRTAKLSLVFSCLNNSVKTLSSEGALLCTLTERARKLTAWAKNVWPDAKLLRERKAKSEYKVCVISKMAKHAVME